MKVNNDPELDKIYCKSVAKSLSEILRFSLDEEFRNQTFDLFRVKSSKETEKEINKSLLSIIQDKNRCAKKCKKRKTRQKTANSSTNANYKPSTSSNKIEAPSSCVTRTNDDFQTTLINFSKKNWLKISSEKYKETLKNKQDRHYSQPVFSQTQVDNVDALLNNCSAPSNICFQLSPELFSSCSLSQEYSSSSLEPFDNNKNF